MGIFTPKRFVRTIGGVAHSSGTYSNVGESWWEIADRVRARENYKCQVCQKFLGKHGGHVHHVRRLSRKGVSASIQLQLLCEEHHEEKHPHMQRRNSLSNPTRGRK
jgi:5-methylcytosine-specific restriction endonuclease McrA